jgi:hypothetical protein
MCAINLIYICFLNNYRRYLIYSCYHIIRHLYTCQPLAPAAAEKLHLRTIGLAMDLALALPLNIQRGYAQTNEHVIVRVLLWNKNAWQI